jgi:hypothetical protein
MAKQASSKPRSWSCYIRGRRSSSTCYSRRSRP